MGVGVGWVGVGEGGVGGGRGVGVGGVGTDAVRTHCRSVPGPEIRVETTNEHTEVGEVRSQRGIPVTDVIVTGGAVALPARGPSRPWERGSVRAQRSGREPHGGGERPAPDPPRGGAEAREEMDPLASRCAARAASLRRRRARTVRGPRGGSRGRGASQRVRNHRRGRDRGGRQGGRPTRPGRPFGARPGRGPRLDAGRNPPRPPATTRGGGARTGWGGDSGPGTEPNAHRIPLLRGPLLRTLGVPARGRPGRDGKRVRVRTSVGPGRVDGGPGAPGGPLEGGKPDLLGREGRRTRVFSRVPVDLQFPRRSHKPLTHPASV